MSQPTLLVIGVSFPRGTDYLSIDALHYSNINTSCIDITTNITWGPNNISICISNNL